MLDIEEETLIDHYVYQKCASFIVQGRELGNCSYTQVSYYTIHTQPPKVIGSVCGLVGPSERATVTIHHC